MAKIKAQSSGLSQRALLVAVNISQWAGRRLDKKATETVNLTHKTDATAGAYHKRLLPGAKELGEVQLVASQVRKYYYEQTLPWMSDGTRIISAKNYLKFVSDMRQMTTTFNNAVKDFEAAYPRLKTEAQKRLGDLYDASEYPDDIKEKFSLEVSYIPLPDVKDFRVEISEAEKREFQRKMKQVESDAMRECWARLHGVVKTAAEKLARPDAIFRDSLIENITEVANLLPMLNISEDAKLESATKEVLDIVSKMSSETLRANVSERDKASKALSDIESRMGAFMGVKK